MAQEQMLRARDLIKKKRYDEARQILGAVDHPKAREWLAKLDEVELGDPFEGEVRRPVAPTARLSPEVAAARTKSYTNAVVIVLILYFALWLPGLIANVLYLKEAERMQNLAGAELPGVNALHWERFIFATVPLALMLIGGVLLLVFSVIVASRY